MIEIEDFRTSYTYSQAEYDAFEVEAYKIYHEGNTAKRSIARGDTAPTRVRNGTVGKLGEAVCYGAFEGASRPDLDAWEADNDHRFAIPDIVTPDYDIHVKTCETDREGHNSWLIDITDRALTNPSPRDRFVFCSYQDLKVQIVAIATFADIEDLLSRPKSDKLIGKKYAVWASDLRTKADKNPGTIQWVCREEVPQDINRHMRGAVRKRDAGL